MPKTGSFRRLLRNLRLMHEAEQSSSAKITIHEDCKECGSRVSFEFRDIPLRQTVFSHCWKCGELLRLCRTVK